MSDQQFVIVGGSLAGVKAAETLRAEGFDGSVVVIDPDEELPYERPPLSKNALQGQDDWSVALLHDEAWYGEHDIDLRRGRRVTGIDPTGHTVSVDGDRAALRYDKLLLATGAEPRRLDVPGGDAAGVLYLRTMADSQLLQQRLAEKPRVVVVGAGWIGLEVAAAARIAGAAVTVVEPQSTALLGPLGPEIGRVFAQVHEDHGVSFRFGVRVEEILAEGGSVAGVRTSAGETLAADVVVVGVGAVPRVELAREAGLRVDDGVVVDESLRTSHPDVFAAGDLANFASPVLGYRVRVEHWANAHDGGAAAARAMLDQAGTHDALPFFWSDQYDAGMEYAGDVPAGTDATVITRGDVAGREFMAFWLARGRVLAGMHVNVWDTMDAVQDLIRSRRAVDLAQLADPDVALSDL